jgi:cupin fold WbuC family metalloprotein
LDLPLNKINDEVYITSDEIVRLGSREVVFIRECALQNSRGRARICARKEATDTLHEMLIGIRSDSYIRPHRHEQKVESFHRIDGIADIVVLDDDGDISDIVELSPPRNFYYRLDIPRYHTLLI